MGKLKNGVVNKHGIDIIYFSKKLTELRRDINNEDLTPRQVIDRLQEMVAEAKRVHMENLKYEIQTFRER